ncbi:MAG: AsmA family protein [Candidatus Omnitrophica bacterium]|nr:AsmA family protein [Candidatus Omnitrophota bacterium]
MKKLLQLIIVLVVVTLVVLVLGRNVFAKFAIEKGVEAATGLPLNIKKLDLGLSTTHVAISDLKLLSPKGFNNEVMFSAPEIFVDYDLGAMMKGKVRLEDIRLNFDQFVVIRNKDGQLNLDALKPKEGKRQEPAQQGKKDEGKKGKAPEVQIDHLALKIGKVVYKDYSQGTEPVINEYNVNISEEMDNVTDLNSLLGFIANKAMAKTALSSLGDFNVDAFKGAVSVPQETIDTFKQQVDVFKGAIKFPGQE